MIDTFLGIYTVFFIVATGVCMMAWAGVSGEFGPDSPEAWIVAKVWLAAVTFPVTFPFTLYLLIKYAFNEGE